MRKLFKAAFKSLSVNKVSIIGLSILVFLASSIFTMLYGVETAYQSQLDAYGRIGNIHDLTVDLDLKASGENSIGDVYNTDPEEIYQTDGSLTTNKQVEVDGSYQTFATYQSQYQWPANLKDSAGQQIDYNNWFVNSKNIQTLFNNYQSQINSGITNPNLAFNFDNPNQPYFTLASFPISFQQYVVDPQKTGTYKKPEINLALKAGDNLSWRRNYTLGDLLKENSGLTTNDKSYELKYDELYLNLQTKQLSFNNSDRYSWDNAGVLYTYSKNDLKALLHLNSNGYFISNKTLFSVATNFVNNGSQGTTTYKISDLTLPLTSTITVPTESSDPGDFKVLTKAKKDNALSSPVILPSSNEQGLIHYNFPASWVLDQTRITNYINHKFSITNLTSPWEGSYKLFIEKYDSDPTTSKYNYLHYWSKEVQITTAGKTETINYPISPADFAVKIKKDNNPVTTIDKLEKLDFNSPDYYTRVATLINSNVKQETVSEIMRLASTIATTAVKEKVTNLVGSENVGQRQAITADAVDPQTGASNTYQFVNMNPKIAGNVDKLFRETESGTSTLNNFAESSRPNEEVVPVEYGLKMAEAIFNGFKINGDYFNPIVTFDSYTKVDQVQHLQTLVSNKKIVQFNNQKTEWGVVKTNDNKYDLLIKANNIWTTSPDFQESTTYQALLKYLQSQNAHISGTIGIKKSWYQVDPNYSNRIYVPVLYRNIPSGAINEATTDNTYNEFVDRIGSRLKSLLSNDVDGNPLISNTNYLNLLDALKKSLTDNNFGSAMATGLIDKGQMTKIILDMFYYFESNSSDNVNAVSSLFSGILENLKKTIQKNGNPKNYFNTQITKLLDLLKSLGIELPEIFPTDQIFKYVKDPVAMINGMQTVINSFDSHQAFEEIYNWTSKNWDKKQPDQTYTYFGTKELMLPILNNLNWTNIKTGLNQVVSNLDFNAMLNPNLSSSISYGILKDMETNPAKPTTAEGKAVKNLFLKLGLENTGTPEAPVYVTNFSNFGVNLNGLINNFDGNTFTKDLTTGFESYQFKETFDDQTRTYQGWRLSQSALYGALIHALTQNGTQTQFVDFLSNLLNLSGKTSNFLGFLQPVPDPAKTDLFDLQGLEKLQYQKIANDLKMVEELLVKVKLENFVFDIKEAIFLETQLKITDFSNVKEIKIQLENYQSVLNLLVLNNLTVDQQNSAANGYLKFPDPKNMPQNFSLADLALWQLKFIDESTAGLAWSTYSGAYDAVKDGISNPGLSPSDPNYNPNAIYAPGANSLVINNFWINFMFETVKQAMANGESYQNAVIIAEESASTLFNFATNVKTETDPSGLGKLLPANQRKTDPISKFSGLQVVPTGLVYPEQTAQTLFNDNRTGKTLGFQNILKQFEIDGHGYIADYLNSNEIKTAATLSMVAFNVPSTFVSDFSTWNTFRKGSEAFINNLFSNNQLVKNFDQLSFLNTMSNQASVQSNAFIAFGLSSALASTYLGVMFAQPAAWYTTNEKNIAGAPSGNIDFVLKQRLSDFSKMSFDQIKKRMDLFTQGQYLNNTVQQFGKTKLNLDMDKIDYTKNHLDPSLTPHQNDVFGLDLGQIYYESIDAATNIINDNNQIVFYNPGAFVAKVNDAWIEANNKESFTGELPTDIGKIDQFVQTLDNKYILNVNGSKFVIIGADSTPDYEYPVIDSAHITVDTKSQAIVYVNQYGFDRIRDAYRETGIDNYLVVKKGNSNLTVPQLTTQINQYIHQNKFADFSNKAFSANGPQDPIHPERTLRVAIPEGVLYAVGGFNVIALVILLTLVGVVTIFIGKRYISNNKVVIGILKAQGYRPIEIALSFTVFALVTALIGGVLGYILGFFLQSPIMNTLSTFWTIPTSPFPFSWVALFLTVLIPFVGMSLMIVLTALWTLRQNATVLISGKTEINTGLIARFFLRPFQKFSITTRFRASLALNSFGKMMSLASAFTLASFVVLFAISSSNVFTTALDNTFEQRSYSYKTDLFSPTTEGGPYNLITKNSDANVNNLYVPTGDNSVESSVWLANYFAPGNSAVLNADPNHKPEPIGSRNAAFMTKSSLDINIDSSLAVNAWKTAANSLPDTQYQQILNFTQSAAYRVEQTQVISRLEAPFGNHPKGWEYGGNDPSNPQNYFKYYPIGDSNDGHFKYKIYDHNSGNYQVKAITNIFGRNEYEAFLKAAYHQGVDDFWLVYGGINFDSNEDEVYSYADVQMPNDNSSGAKVRIYGYQQNSSNIKPINDAGDPLLDKLYQAPIGTDRDGSKIYPLVINNVTQRQNGWNIGDTINFRIENNVNRYVDQITNTNSETVAKFKIIDINSSYVGNELITTQPIINEIIGLNNFEIDKEVPTGTPLFNGIFTKDPFPTQSTENILLYSKSGYWPGLPTIDTQFSSLTLQKNIFEQIFNPNDNSVLILDGLNENQINDFFSTTNQSGESVKHTYQQVLQDPNLITIMLNKFNQIYGDTIYSLATANIESKDISFGFTSELSYTVNQLTIAFTIVAIIISVIVLIVVSTMIVAENKRKIATFAVLGYSSRERAKLFLSVYVPFIIFAVLVAIPIAYGFFILFNTIILKAAGIALPLSLTFLNTFLAILVIFIIFAVAIVFAWYAIRKIKGIEVLKGGK